MKIPEVEKQALIELYNKGVSHEKIAEELGGGWYKEKVSKAVHELVVEGLVISRTEIRLTQHTKELHAEKIAKLYNEGKERPEIAQIMGMTESTIDSYLCDLNKKGIIVRRIKKREPKKTYEKLGVKNIPWDKRPTGAGETTLKPGETVKCNLQIAHTCIYGTGGNGYAGFCNYYLIMGEKRPCSNQECNLYSKITKDNPRRRWKDLDY